METKEIITKEPEPESDLVVDLYSPRAVAEALNEVFASFNLESEVEQVDIKSAFY